MKSDCLAVLGLLATCISVAAAEHVDPPRLERAATVPGLAPWEPLPLLSGQRTWLPLVTSALRDTNPVIRRRALFTLGCLRLSEGRALARPALADTDRRVRVQAAVALVSLGDSRGLAGTTIALREGPEWLRLYALQGLWRLNSREARARLKGSAAYLTPFLAQCLKQALAQRPEPSRPPPLVETLPPPAGRHDLWLEVCDAFILESDHWWHLGDHEQAIRCQQTAVFFDPANVEAFTNIAWLQWSAGRHGEAISTYRQTLAANPRSWQAADALGQYYLRHHQTEPGVEYLQRAAKLGSPPVPRRVLGHALERLGRHDEARAVWSDILELDPTDPIARRQLERLQGL